MKPNELLPKVIAMESETVSIYRNLANNSECTICRDALLRIIDEELLHIGELYSLYNRFCSKDIEQIKKGIEEIEKENKEESLISF